jgi:dihydropteroate synthase
MIPQIITIDNLEQAAAELLAIGVDPAGVRLMAPKAVARVVKVANIRPVAANIIKQEMLSFGGETATSYGSINHSVPATDILIIGQERHFSLLIEKLKAHQFGLPQLAEQLFLALKNYNQVPAPLKIKNQEFVFGERTYIMGVVNVTPDSFSDGGDFLSPPAAVARAQELIAAGADIIDIGGESTRPGAAPVSAEEEKKRVLPVIEKLAAAGAIVSIDTSKAIVAEAAVKAGAGMINDITGLSDPAMAAVMAKTKAAVCLMHIQGTPQTMQVAPAYSDVMAEIIDYLDARLAIAGKAGILLDKIIVDPGFGFGKTVNHNLTILSRLSELKVLGRPILAGTSRKAFIGTVLDLPVTERLEGTIATVALSIANGADIVRVHDVKEIKRAAKMADAIVRRKKDGEKS